MFVDQPLALPGSAKNILEEYDLVTSSLAELKTTLNPLTLPGSGQYFDDYIFLYVF